MSTTKNILVLTYWSYKEGLIQTYTLPYVRMIRKNVPSNKKVYLLTLEKETMALSAEEKKKAKDRLKGEGITWLALKYIPFGGSAIIKWAFVLPLLWLRIIFSGISHIHAWCTPPGMLGYLLAKFSGKKLVLDSFEPHAEAMIENGDWTKDSKAYRMLFKFEKKQVRKAQHVIATTEGMRQYSRDTYGYEPSSFFVKPACVDLSLFGEHNLKRPELIKDLGLEDKIVGVYAGKFGGIYYDKEVYQFLKSCVDFWGDKFRMLLLTNHSREEIEGRCAEAGIDPKVVLSRFVMHHEIPDYMGSADFAITPVKSIPTKRYCTPIKDGEYWALGLPIIISKNISDDSQIIEDNQIGEVIDFENPAEFTPAIERMSDFLQKTNRGERFDKIRYIAQKYRNFSVAENIYKKVYGNG